MARYRAKAVEVKAVQVRSDNLRKVCDFLGGEERRNLDFSINYSTGRVGILPISGVRDGVTAAFPGDWVIKGPQGELTAITDVLFRAKYEQIG